MVEKGIAALALADDKVGWDVSIQPRASASPQPGNQIPGCVSDCQVCEFINGHDIAGLRWSCWHMHTCISRNIHFC